MPIKAKPKSAKSKPVRGARARAGGGSVVCLAAYVPVELAQRARIQAVTQGVTVSQLVAGALVKTLSA
jgi:uncharacterized membrane protein